MAECSCLTVSALVRHLELLRKCAGDWVAFKAVALHFLGTTTISRAHVHMQVVVAAVKINTLLALALVVIICILKKRTFQHQQFLVLNDGFHILQLALCGLLLVCLSTFVGVLLRRTALARRTGNKWHAHTRAALRSAAIKAAVTFTQLVLYIVVNAVILADAGQACHESLFLAVCITLLSVGWNTILLSVVVDAHGAILCNVRCHPSCELADC